MGLFSYYVGYKRGKNKATRRREREESNFAAESEDTCGDCGYAQRQHSDQGECPSY